MSFGGFAAGYTGGFGDTAVYGLLRGSNNPVGNCEPQAGPPAKSTTAQLDELYCSLARLFTSGSYSDLTITCGDDRYKVHQALICPRSAFFEAALKCDFKETENAEIDLPDDDPMAVKMMVHYFYHLDYPLVATRDNDLAASSQTRTLPGPSAPSLAVEPTQRESLDSANNSRPTHASRKKKAKRAVKESSIEGSSMESPTGFIEPEQVPNLALHAKVYALGEKYGINGLKTVAVKKFEDEVKDHWDGDDFILAVREVYTSTADHDRAMQDVVIRTFSDHLSLLDKTSVQDVIKDLGLAFDILLYLKKGGRIR